jgi:fumarate hydratase class II
MSDIRIEKDSLGVVELPDAALYGPQTQRAINNFTISRLRLPRAMIRALGLLKAACAQSNGQLGLLPQSQVDAIETAALEVAAGRHDEQFPVDIFQTGSGTSSNMNANEVISHIASARLGEPIHPNDQVNLGQSSNDIFPSAIHLAAWQITTAELIPALDCLKEAIERRSEELAQVVVTGRTHLMDAVPMTLGQSLSGWAHQLVTHRGHITQSLNGLRSLALGGTAVGTGINTHPDFAARAIEKLNDLCGGHFTETQNHFAAQSAVDDVVTLSGQLKGLATALMKIANDLRWMNSGPNAGLGEITLPPLQPGSSIMPGKVNPVIPEAVAMVCAQAMGNDLTISIAAQSGNFQLNAMLPIIGFNLIQSLEILSNATLALAEKCIGDFDVHVEHMRDLLIRNPTLATALNPIIGYDAASEIAKEAALTGDTVLEVAKRVTDIDHDRLTELLDPERQAVPAYKS